MIGLLQSPDLTSWVVGQDQLTATSWRSILHKRAFRQEVWSGKFNLDIPTVLI
ncbi:MAG: hypothetical protein WCS37_12285 [Chloroflexota bacterium]|nr:hypothetical protein [Chloroflexota bacterium]